MPCPGGMDSNGCMLPMTCISLIGKVSIIIENKKSWKFFNFYLKIQGTVGTDGTNCTVTCPANCPFDMKTCYGGSDSNGCPMSDTCINIPTDIYGNGCPVTCPADEPVCTDDQISCTGGKDYNGCQKPNTCISSTGKKTYLHT